MVTELLDTTSDQKRRGMLTDGMMLFLTMTQYKVILVMQVKQQSQASLSRYNHDR